MSKYQQQLLEKLRSQDKAAKPDYYLFFLGTEVNFVAKPDTKKVAPYVRGETFSFAAQLTAQLLGEEGVELKGPVHVAHAYHSTSIDVINGPNTLGDEAGDRIAKGLLLSLQAIANGQTTLNLSGFSRGGVEAIVLTHELKRVKEALEIDLGSTNKQSLVSILKNTSSVTGGVVRTRKYTQEALETLLKDPIPAAEEEALKKALLSGLQQLKINLFALDPVPGDSVLVGWDEPTFYFLPEFVEKRLELVQQHETSNCFKAVIPKGMPYEVIPGCHGTGDGNQFDDTGNEIKADKTDVSAVQDLVLQRWLDFMSFTIEDNERSKELVADHPALNNVAFNYLKASPDERDQLLLSSYQRILENYPAFIFLATKCYSTRQFGPERHILYHSSNNSIPIGDIHPHGKRETFVNKEHVSLWIKKSILAFDFNKKTFNEQMAWIKENIKYAFKEVVPPEAEAPEKSAQNTHELDDLMREQIKNPTLLADALSMLNSTLILTYLRNHLKQEDLESYHQYFNETIAILKSAISAENISKEKKATAILFMQSIQNGLTNNLYQHSKDLLSQPHRLFDESEKIVQQIFDHEITAEQIKQDVLSWLVNTQEYISKLINLSAQVRRLAPYCNQEELAQALKELSNSSLHYNQGEKPTVNELSIRLQGVIAQSIIMLKNQGGVLLKATPELLNHKGEGLNEDFFQEIRHLAKGMGAELAEDLQEQEARALREQEERIQFQNSLRALEESSQKTGQAYEQLELKQEQLLAKHDSLQQQVHNLIQERTVLLEQHAQAIKASQKIEKSHEQLELKQRQLLTENTSLRRLVDELKQEAKKVSDSKKAGLKKLEAQDAEHKAAQDASLQQRALLQLEKKAALNALNQWQTPKEQNALITLTKLQEKTNEYFEHLQEQESNHSLLEQKKLIVSGLKETLENTKVLPSRRLVQFQKQLTASGEQLKEHRDPTWQRFFRDCFRIIGLIFSGIAVYRAAAGRCVQFFRPTEGEQYLKEVVEPIKGSRLG